MLPESVAKGGANVENAEDPRNDFLPDDVLMVVTPLDGEKESS